MNQNIQSKIKNKIQEDISPTRNLTGIHLKIVFRKIPKNKFDPEWIQNGPFALKGIMSVEDAKRAVDIGATAIMISNHGGRQLDGSRAPFDQLQEIVNAVGDKIEVILDGGIRRGTHVLKALSLGAKACSMGKAYLYALSAGGQIGVEMLLTKMKSEIERDMTLMGCRSVKELNKNKIAFR